MKSFSFYFQPLSSKEKYVFYIYNLLVENFSKTYFVGGMVRDKILGRPINDFDIATEARVAEIQKILVDNGLKNWEALPQFGTVNILLAKGLKIVITTMRKEKYFTNRYPRIEYTNYKSEDAKRRDFTMNSLYFSAKHNKIYDFFNGYEDIKNKIIRSIGSPEMKLKQDPLRIIRAWRFMLALDFKLDHKLKKAIANNKNLINTLTHKKIVSEIKKLDSNSQKIICGILNKEILDETKKYTV